MVRQTCMQNVNICTKANELIKQAGVEWMWSGKGGMRQSDVSPRHVSIDQRLLYQAQRYIQ